MVRFLIGQKWNHHDGKMYGEVEKISDEGRRGVLVVTDDKGNFIERWSGTAAELQGPGQWQLCPTESATSSSVVGQSFRVY